MALPTITIAGNLTADPDLRYTNSGTGWVKLRVAANERKKNEAGEWIDGDSLFIDAVAWRNAEMISNRLRKGAKVVIYGTLKSRSYETETGEKRTVFEISADYVASILNDQVTPVTENTTYSAPAVTEDAPF